jgi:hypothetical protein
MISFDIDTFVTKVTRALYFHQTFAVVDEKIYLLDMQQFFLTEESVRPTVVVVEHRGNRASGRSYETMSLSDNLPLICSFYSPIHK